MRRISLQTYFELAENLERTRDTLSTERTRAGLLYFRLDSVRGALKAFMEDDSAFSVCKHSASEFIKSISIVCANFESEDGNLIFEKLKEDVEGWQYRYLVDKLNDFRSVFLAECNDASIYLAEPILIYKISDLVDSASKRIPAEVIEIIPKGIVSEFDQAGRAMAFGLPTACGFHALRALEIMMGHYLNSFGYSGKKCVSWFDHIDAMRKLAEDESRVPNPSQKVVSMLDRMRQLDRNPLMHPEDTLDSTQSETLFSLAAITIIEMARDLALREPILSQGNLPLIPTLSGSDNSEGPDPISAESKGGRKARSGPPKLASQKNVGPSRRP